MKATAAAPNPALAPTTGEMLTVATGGFLVSAVIFRAYQSAAERLLACITTAFQMDLLRLVRAMVGYVVFGALGGLLGGLTLVALRRAGFFAYLAEKK